jgi:hypothetical protein
MNKSGEWWGTALAYSLVQSQIAAAPTNRGRPLLLIKHLLLYPDIHIFTGCYPTVLHC